MMRPVIGIAVWKRRLDTALGEGDVLHALADEYVQALVRAGAAPVLLPTLPPDYVPILLDLVDGVVLTGGADVDPASYGADDEGVSYGVEEESDAFELALVRHAESRDMPVLGICRGCQILNVAFGGTLHQEITSPDGVHKPLQGQTGPELIAGRHDIDLSPGSALAGVYGESIRSVNTIHHQAIAEVADGFEAVATAPDGVVEAIEASGSWTAVGVQWHPERLDAAAEEPLFTSFVDAVRSRIAEPGGVRFVR